MENDRNAERIRVDFVSILVYFDDHTGIIDVGLVFTLVKIFFLQFLRYKSLFILCAGKNNL